MPKFIAYKTGNNPHPASRSRKSRAQDTPSFVVQIKAPLADANEQVWVFLTKATTHTVLGELAAEEFGVNDEQQLDVSLVNDKTRHAYPLTVCVHKTKPGSLPGDYFELGWEVIESEFKIGKVSPNGRLLLTAKNDFCEEYETYL